MNFREYSLISFSIVTPLLVDDVVKRLDETLSVQKCFQSVIKLKCNGKIRLPN